MKRLYIDSASKKTIEYYNIHYGDNVSHKRDSNIPVQIYKEVIATGRFFAVDSEGTSRPDAALLKNNNVIAGSTLNEYNEFDKFSIPENITHINETVIWGGFIHFHYGHFLMQSTARIYYHLKNRERPIVFVANKRSLPKYIEDFFKLLKIPADKIILITKYTKFKEIILPPLSSFYYKDWTEDFLLPFHEIAKNIEPGQNEKIFFTRKYWKGLTPCLGEEKIEKIFIKNGFTPVAMEKLTLKEQISVIKGAKVIAGIDGTAFHNILFSSNKPKIIFLQRSIFYNSQYIVNEAVEADWYLIKTHRNPLPVSHAFGPFIVGMTSELKTFMREHNMNDFNCKFQPLKYIKKFYKYYKYLYVNKQYRPDVEDISIYDFIYLQHLVNYKVKKIIYLISYKLTFGYKRKLRKSIYIGHKNLKFEEFKY